MRQPCPIRYQLLACPRRALFSAAKVTLEGSKSIYGVYLDVEAQFWCAQYEFWSKLPQVAITVPGTSPFVARARSQPAVEEMSLCMVYIYRQISRVC